MKNLSVEKQEELAGLLNMGIRSAITGGFVRDSNRAYELLLGFGNNDIRKSDITREFGYVAFEDLDTVLKACSDNGIGAGKHTYWINRDDIKNIVEKARESGPRTYIAKYKFDDILDLWIPLLIREFDCDVEISNKSDYVCKSYGEEIKFTDLLSDSFKKHGIAFGDVFYISDSEIKNNRFVNPETRYKLTITGTNLFITNLSED